MDNMKDDTYYTGKILDDLSFIERHTKNTDPEAFLENEILQDSMKFRLIQISENTRKLSDEFKAEHPVYPGQPYWVSGTELFTITVMWICLLFSTP